MFVFDVHELRHLNSPSHSQNVVQDIRILLHEQCRHLQDCSEVQPHFMTLRSWSGINLTPNRRVFFKICVLVSDGIWWKLPTSRRIHYFNCFRKILTQGKINIISWLQYQIQFCWHRQKVLVSDGIDENNLSSEVTLNTNSIRKIRFSVINYI